MRFANPKSLQSGIEMTNKSANRLGSRVRSEEPVRAHVTPSTVRMEPSQSGKNVDSENGAGPNQAAHQVKRHSVKPSQRRRGTDARWIEGRRESTESGWCTLDLS
jgi:hypothetical protein